FGRTGSDNLTIDSNTSRFYVEGMDSGVAYANSLPQREGVLGGFSALCDSTLSSVSFQRGGTLTRTGTGSFSFTFDKALPSADYVCSLTLEAVTGGITHLAQVVNRGTTGVSFRTYAIGSPGTPADTTTQRVEGVITRFRSK